MLASQEKTYGEIIKEARLAKGWSRQNLADVYSRFFKGEAVISEDTIRMWEEYNKVPKRLKRRYVLAILLDIPLAALGLEALNTNAALAADLSIEKVDLEKARRYLLRYKKQHHATTVADMLDNVMEIIYSIHDELPYASGSRKIDLSLLLCEYQQFLAGVFRDHARFAEALKYQNNAYQIAKSLEQNANIMALVLWRRGLTYHQQGKLDAAIMDFQQALSKKPDSLQLQGAIQTNLGLAMAEAAKDQQDLTQAMKTLDVASNALDEAQKEPDEYFIRFNREGYYLNRASAWLYNSDGKLRSASDGLDTLVKVPVNAGRKRRYAYSLFLQAQAWFDQREYPLATQLATDALTIGIEIQSYTILNKVERVYSSLKKTSYGKAVPVAELGVKLLEAKHPEVFA
uniref:Uncharacterized protein n=1 Tax=Thermosporothrix sp. COM3 TaxID=2490863 RepID=A0A455SX16_9CHLR|nr:hypothetical protein KTC_64720 [Thermosporothrix sp. COM3]